LEPGAVGPGCGELNSSLEGRGRGGESRRKEFETDNATGTKAAVASLVYFDNSDGAGGRESLKKKTAGKGRTIRGLRVGVLKA